LQVLTSVRIYIDSVRIFGYLFSAPIITVQIQLYCDPTTVHVRVVSTTIKDICYFVRLAFLFHVSIRHCPLL